MHLHLNRGVPEVMSYCRGKCWIAQALATFCRPDGYSHSPLVLPSSEPHLPLLDPPLPPALDHLLDRLSHPASRALPDPTAIQRQALALHDDLPPAAHPQPRVADRAGHARTGSSARARTKRGNPAQTGAGARAAGAGGRADHRRRLLRSVGLACPDNRRDFAWWSRRWRRVRVMDRGGMVDGARAKGGQAGPGAHATTSVGRGGRKTGQGGGEGRGRRGCRVSGRSGLPAEQKGQERGGGVRSWDGVRLQTAGGCEWLVRSVWGLEMHCMNSMYRFSLREGARQLVDERASCRERGWRRAGFGCGLDSGLAVGLRRPGPGWPRPRPRWARILARSLNSPSNTQDSDSPLLRTTYSTSGS